MHLPSARLLSRRVAACASITGLALTATALPVALETPTLTPAAYAADCSDPFINIAGEMQWGVRESFRKYITGPIAKGSYSTRGDVQESGNGFTFKLSNSYMEDTSDKGILAATGALVFSGHGGKLATTFTDPILTFTGPTTASLTLLVDSQDPEGKKLDISGKRVNFATVTFQESPRSSGSFIGEVTLTSDGAHSFADFYEPGTVMDPLTIVVTNATSACGQRPTQGGTTSGTTSGTASGKYDIDTGHPGLDALGLLNRYLTAGNDAMTNSLKLVDNLDKIVGRNRPTAPTTSGTTSQPTTASTAPSVGPLPTTGSGTSTGSVARSSNPTQQAGNSATPPATTGTLSVPTGGECSLVTQSAVAWGVKTSFRSYVSGSIAKGGWTLNGVEERGGVFQFRGSQGSVDASSRSGSVATTGSLRFTGHKGILDLVIADPQIVFTGDQAQLVAEVSSQDMSGNPHNYGRVALGDIALSELTITSNAVSGSGSVRLTAVGAQAFADFYEPGIELDPIRFQAALGGSTTCGTHVGQASGARRGDSGSSAATAAQLRSNPELAGSLLNSSTSGASTGTASAGTDSLDLLSGADASPTTTAASTSRGDGQVTIHRNTAKRDDDSPATGVQAAAAAPAMSSGNLAVIVLAFLAGAGACLVLASREQRSRR